MGLKAKRPKQTAEEASLLAAQTREIDRQDQAINEKKRMLIRSQLSSRASLLSGNLKSKQDMTSVPGAAGATGMAGRTGAASSSGGGGPIAAVVSRVRKSKFSLLE